MKDNPFDFTDFMEVLFGKRLAKDGLRPDFKRTGIRTLDEAIAKCMDLNDQMQRLKT